MIRGSIKRTLLPYLIRHILFGLIGASLLFITYLMVRYILALGLEAEHTKQQEQINQHQRSNLSSEQVLHCIKNFLMLALFGSLQLFGLYGLIRNNRHILFGYGSCLVVAFIFTLIDQLFTAKNSLPIAIFFVIQSVFVFFHLMLIRSSKCRPTSNIHYIPMPIDDPTLCSPVIDDSRSRYISQKFSI